LTSYRDGLPARRQSPIRVLTGPAVEQLRWFDTTRYRYATPPTTVVLLYTAAILFYFKFLHHVRQLFPVTLG